MPDWARLALVGLLLAPLVPGSASAQFRRNTSLIHGPITIGPRVGRDFENHAWSLGGQIGIPAGKRLELRPSGDLFFPKHGDTGWQLNGDAAIHLGQGGGLYAGGGVAFSHPGGGGTKTGYNLFFGLGTSPPLQRLKPFVEFRWTFVNDTSPFRLALGFTYGV
ncbi:MAG TPA: hypothetical protein VFN08_02115 [Gemmatimonadales bacterium]|jgi:hypothetical protein|nr:hypothetical protein [Gemmatimonadales bacterium]